LWQSPKARARIGEGEFTQIGLREDDGAAACSRSITAALRSGTKVLNKAEPYVVGIELLSNWSFTSTGMQWSGPLRRRGLQAWRRTLQPA